MPPPLPGNRAWGSETQAAYERAFRTLFAALNGLESRPATRRYLFGARIVESDWRLFCTLLRFDAVYHGHFKCNLRRIADYPNLYGWLRDLCQQPGIAATVIIGTSSAFSTSHTTSSTRRASSPLDPLLDTWRMAE